jgi:alkylation response protein AidB-like acyl-CoA dehydrogenase
MVAIVPAAQAEIIDNWRVAGLRGSGSFDFRLDEVFVAAALTFERAASACRGGTLFNVEAHVFLSNELPPLMVGLARRALDEMTRLPGVGYPAFHEELGRAEASIRAARAVHRDAVAATWEVARTGQQPSASDHTALATASVFAAETCTDVVSGLFRFGGERLLSGSELMQRLLRDVLAARQHIGLSEEAYERAGRDRVSARDQEHR